MLHLLSGTTRDCEGISRRSFLQVGSAGLATMSLPHLLQWEAAGAGRERGTRIRNCITIFLVGSPGHLDTWDLKPDAPAEVRGKPSTNVNSTTRPVEVVRDEVR